MNGMTSVEWIKEKESAQVIRLTCERIGAQEFF